jgi:two-component system, chemotaxis family, CheB/CheR fusion protein
MPDSHPRRGKSGSADFLVVGIGASAGGLDACRKFVSALPTETGLAFILVQHLDPSHESMMAELLDGHTTLSVQQATDGQAIEVEHLYVIPPGAYLSVADGMLHLSRPTARHGARLPFDFLLKSLAAAYGPRACCVILSGSGADGTLGLAAIKKRGGLVVVQDPKEAAYDGMPDSAIRTGLVDLVLPVSEVPAALAHRDHQKTPLPPNGVSTNKGAGLAEIVDLLRRKTAHDFTYYKEGTLERRIHRRMTLAGIEAKDMQRYHAILDRDSSELELLAKDLLINVTGFFRDPKVFDLLAEKIIPEMVSKHEPSRPLRIWIAGCSTGEEPYSLAILFREEIAAAKLNIKLQVFASDVDPEAIVSAREGLYPTTIESDVSSQRLDRFFTKEDHGYRILPELRATVVFTVQDVMVDPPFSQLDLVSCRNLLIYLGLEAQVRVLSLFHVALRPGGVLLLGSSETAGNADDRFEVVSKAARLYRRIGRTRPGEIGLAVSNADGARLSVRPRQSPGLSRQAALAELCRKHVMESYAPAAILINGKNECVFSLGPTDRYLSVASGHPTHDLLAMARPSMRTKLRSAIHRANEKRARILVPGGRLDRGAEGPSFNIAIEPVESDGEPLLLICFLDDQTYEKKRGQPLTPQDAPRVAELEQELDATRAELRGAIHSLEISNEEQNAINEEALSVNEEYQSTNEELLTSKEELQSLNEELTALNGQLQETLESQRTTSNDLQNILYSTDVATLFLDPHLKIRFFTPATRSLFSVIASDVGRPLEDLNALSSDTKLLIDARSTLETLAPIEREIEAKTGAWYLRRVLPYRTDDNGVGGVVITFTDITDRKAAAKALEDATRRAETANTAKSRFLAAASHDLRQPLQTLSLIQGLLSRKVLSDNAHKLVGMLSPTLTAMSGMLNTLLDINQIDAGTVHAQAITFPIATIFDRMRDEFTYHAQSQGLELIVVPCTLSVHTDPHLLEQMIRNLLANALKYTRYGKILLGCRRRRKTLSIEVWDTGIGIPDGELESIFYEYHQVDNPARDRSRGLGLGLPIVQRLGELLGHHITVRSNLGRGSVFAIEVARETETIDLLNGPKWNERVADEAAESRRRTGTILVIEDDGELRELLDLLLSAEGHHVVTAPDGVAALDLVARGSVRPALILSDYNLPNGMDGLQACDRIRARLHRHVPVIILTGDISTKTLQDVAALDCVQLSKPTKPEELAETIQRLLPPPQAEMRWQKSEPQGIKDATAPAAIYVVDDDRHIREMMQRILEKEGFVVETYGSCEDFVAAYKPGGRAACLLIDAYLPGMQGLELLQKLSADDSRLPAIMITGTSDVHMVVEAMKAGASDFIEKPVSAHELLESIHRALEQAQDSSKQSAWRQIATDQVAGLTGRQRQIMDLVLAGHPSKNIAADLGISQRTVENHRASIMKRTSSKSLPELARTALTAASGSAELLLHHGSASIPVVAE